MKKTIIIVRHGNTFLPHEVPTRVGKNTDLPLVETEKAKAVAQWLKNHDIIPDSICAAPLKRTMETATLIKNELSLQCSVIPLDSFTEIDYGPDENKVETEVIKRLGNIYNEADKNYSTSDTDIQNIGRSVLEKWDKEGIVPKGWIVDTEKIKNDWLKFATSLPDNNTTLVCSSNGIIRFAPVILNMPYEEFANKHNIKVSTGSISILEWEDNQWKCKGWNIKPTSNK